jgi:hypothetical protein
MSQESNLKPSDSEACSGNGMLGIGNARALLASLTSTTSMPRFFNLVISLCSIWPTSTMTIPLMMHSFRG